MIVWLHLHDVVILTEIKSSKIPHVPGFIPVVAKTVNSRRGGVVVLVKSPLYPDLCHIDVSTNDQVWFSFSSIPNVRFGGVYVTPSSSPYYSDGDMANIQAKTDGKDVRYIVLGDLNARVGRSAGQLVKHNASYTYSAPVDVTVNDNGKKLLAICGDRNLMLVNNLRTESRSFPGALTFRMRNRWISQLDLCLVSEELIPCVSDFHVNQDITFPSNHAPVSVQFKFPEQHFGLQEVLTRSKDIGTYPGKEIKLCNDPISVSRIDPVLFTEKMDAIDPVMAMQGDHDHDTVAKEFSEVLYSTISESKAPSIQYDPFDPDTTRWERIMTCENDSTLWKAIDWKGQFNPVPTNDENRPSEMEFQEHLEKLLNPADEFIHTDLSNHHVSIPVLDDRIEVREVTNVLEKQVKPDTGCGPDGNSPGVLKLLPVQWVEFICYLFNIVFVAGYPLVWTSAKLIMLFKKGLRNDCNNYRGISVINAIAKVYDYVINNRLMAWYTVCREQAGAQPKRGCIEHIVTYDM